MRYYTSLYFSLDLIVLLMSHMACLLLLLLLWQVQCPSSGIISIRGQPVTYPGCCGIDPIGSGKSGLFLYSGSYSRTNTPIASDQANLKFSTQCNQGDTYTVCEKQGIILTDTLSFKFVGVYPRRCPRACKQLSCT